MRPHQWVKNLLVFAPLLFARKFTDPKAVLASVVAFGVFSALASALYLLNDVVDRDADRNHDRKRLRPIAAGSLPVNAALLASLVLTLVSLAAAFLMPRHGDSPLFVVWPLAYLILNLAYSFYLKRVVIVDCLCIALGFQLRVHAGSVAIGEQSSTWLLLCTFFFALFLALCKRRDEVQRQDTATGETRATMQHYTLPFLDQLIAPMAAVSILGYALYTVAAETIAKHGPHLMFTVPFVVFGVFRYVFLVHRRGAGEDPARILFKDRQLVLCGVFWVGSVLLIFRFG